MNLMRTLTLLLFALLGFAFAERCSEAKYDFFTKPVSDIANRFEIAAGPVTCVSGEGNTYAVIGISEPLEMVDVEFYLAVTYNYTGLSVEHIEDGAWIMGFTKIREPMMIAHFRSDHPAFAGINLFTDAEYVLMFGTMNRN